MGGGCSSSIYAIVSPAIEWKLCIDVDETRSKYVSDRSLESTCSLSELELRALLDSPIAVRFMLSNTNELNCLQLMKLWEELCIYIKKNSGTDQEANLLTILSQFRSLPFLVDNESGELEADLLLEAHEKSLLELLQKCVSSVEKVQLLDDYFVIVRKLCFKQLYSAVYQPFSKTKEYHSLCKLICSPDNWVTINSFKYLNVISQGTFGVVVRCRKISTGKEFAMKIQPKLRLLRHFKKEKQRVMCEMQAYALCDHPFVTKLAYATQTPSLAVLVLPVAVCDLNMALMECAHGRFTMQRAQFYAAEVLSALIYLHDHGILYRDLKPGNILLNADGHIVLADLGSVADMSGLLKSQFNENLSATNNNCFDTTIQRNKRLSLECASVHATIKEVENEVSVVAAGVDIDEEIAIAAEILNAPMEHNASNSSDSNQRTKSLVGTVSYMAPEIIVMLGRRVAHADGYNKAVDYWSYGVLLYRFIVGKEPFNSIPHWRVQNTLTAMLRNEGQSYELMFASIFGNLSFRSASLTPNAIDLIKALLTFDPDHRLGNGKLCDPIPVERCEIRGHPFFEEIDWGKLDRKEIPVPFIPPAYIGAAQDPNAPKEVEFTFADMLMSANKLDWIGADLNMTYAPPVKGLSGMLNNFRDASESLVSSFRGASGADSIGRNSYGRGLSNPASPNTSRSRNRSHGSHLTSSHTATTTGKVDISPNSMYQVEESDQEYFYGWNYVSCDLIESAVELPTQIVSYGTNVTSESTSTGRRLPVSLKIVPMNT